MGLSHVSIHCGAITRQYSLRGYYTSVFILGLSHDSIHCEAITRQYSLRGYHTSVFIAGLSHVSVHCGAITRQSVFIAGRGEGGGGANSGAMHMLKNWSARGAIPATASCSHVAPYLLQPHVALSLRLQVARKRSVAPAAAEGKEGTTAELQACLY